MTREIDNELIAAAKCGRVEALKAALEKGGDVKAGDLLGWTALHYSAVGGYDEAVEVLLAKGADVNAKNRDGQTALQRAGENGNWASAELLRRAEMQQSGPGR